MGDPRQPFHNPFAGLGSLRDALPSGPEPAVDPDAGPSPTSTAAGTAPAAPPARAVVRLERKGRGGKEVTVVAQLGLAATEAERWLRELKQALGCGGGVEADALVFQGDHRRRLAELLRARGVRKVTVG